MDNHIRNKIHLDSISSKYGEESTVSICKTLFSVQNLRKVLYLKRFDPHKHLVDIESICIYPNY